MTWSGFPARLAVVPKPEARAAVYVRISQDRGGASLGVARQEKDCRALCKKLGWQVTQVYTDNDVSAYSGKPRPAYEQMIADIEAGVVDAVVVWHVDRLTRFPRQLEDVIDLADVRRLALATVTGEVDLATPTGRMVARIMGAAARQEAEHKKVRGRSGQPAKPPRPASPAAAVCAPTGTPPTACTSSSQKPRWSEGPRGGCWPRKSLGSVCRELNARGTPTAGGGRWTTTTLRRVLILARISGRREYTPRRVGYRGTRPVLGDIVADAIWPAIIPAEESDRLRQMLTRPERQAPTPPAASTCCPGSCAAGTAAPAWADAPRETSRATCARPPPARPPAAGWRPSPPPHRRLRPRPGPGRPGVPRPGPAPTGPRRRPPRTGCSGRRRRDPPRRARQSYALGELSAPEWRAAREALTGRLEANRAKLAHAYRAAALDGFTGTYQDLRTRWDGLDTGDRRALIAAVLDHVTVKPATRSGWDPDRFGPDWRA